MHDYERNTKFLKEAGTKVPGLSKTQWLSEYYADFIGFYSPQLCRRVDDEIDLTVPIYLDALLEGSRFLQAYH